MAKPDRSRANKKRADKKKQREKRLRLQRNLRRSEPERVADYRDALDIESALEALPTDVAYERVMRRVARATGHRSFANEQEIEAHLSALDPEALAKLTAPDPREKAQDLYYLARDPAHAEYTLDMLEDALEIDPECADAMALLALLDPEEEAAQVQTLERAVAIAERDLREPAESAIATGKLWDDVLSRSYVRTRRMLSSTLYARRRFAESLRHAEVVLALDASDPLFVRGTLIGSLLALGELQRASDQIELLGTDALAFACFARGLERFLAKDRLRAAESVKLGHRVNPLVEERILSNTPASDDGTDDPDGADVRFEAAEVGMILGLPWSMDREAYEWLGSGAPVSTATERALAMQTFVRPASALFAIGEPKLLWKWRDYSQEFGFGAADVPELIRLATDRVLHELEDAPECFGPVHAWRALGQLGDASAILPLLELSLDRENDYSLADDLPRVVAEIGESALPVLIQFLGDHQDVARARNNVIDALGELVAAHPPVRDAVVDVLGKELARYAENGLELNGMIVQTLIDARAVELIPLVREAFEAGLVDDRGNGTLEDIEDAIANGRNAD